MSERLHTSRSGKQWVIGADGFPREATSEDIARLSTGAATTIPQTPHDLNAEMGKVVDSTKERWESKGTLLPRFNADRNSPAYPFQLTGNAIAQILDMVPSAIVGTGQMLANGKEILGALDESAQSNGVWNTAKTIASELGKDFVSDRFTREGFENNPLTIPLDVASLAVPFIKGKGAGSAIASLANKLKPNAKKYAGNIANETFRIPELGLNNVTAQGISRLESSPIDTVNTAKNLGAHPPTVGQMTGDVRAIRNELANPEIGNVIESQQRGIARGIQEFLEQPSLNGTNNQINLAMDTSQATGIIRNQIVKGVKQMQGAYQKSMDITLGNMRSLLGNSKLTNEEVLTNVNTLLAINPKSKEFQALPAKVKSFIPQLKQLKQQYLDDQFNLGDINSDRLTRTITGSKNVMKGGSPAPINYNPDADYTKMIDAAFTSPEKFKRFTQIPGVGKENAAQLLMFKIANKAKVKGTELFDSKILADLLMDKNNAAMFREVLPAQKRVGLQDFAYTMKKFSRYSPSELEAMAFSLSRSKDAALVNIGAAGIPALFGGNFAQMRAGYGIGQAGYLKLKGSVMGRLLMEEPWLMSVIAKTPKNSPALAGRVKQLVKAMGQLHLPAVFEINGEEVEIAPSGVN